MFYLRNRTPDTNIGDHWSGLYSPAWSYEALSRRKEKTRNKNRRVHFRDLGQPIALEEQKATGTQTFGWYSLHLSQEQWAKGSGCFWEH